MNVQHSQPDRYVNRTGEIGLVAQEIRRIRIQREAFQEHPEDKGCGNSDQETESRFSVHQAAALYRTFGADRVHCATG
ncbi:hypothetical protein [Paenibacillus dokdonensis]|uniref:hypothetical protein n=1 Tax=Paenibacillus dokdonensis TaxID=2567944 RepID=UPI003D2AFF19